MHIPFQLKVGLVIIFVKASVFFLVGLSVSFYLGESSARQQYPGTLFLFCLWVGFIKCCISASNQVFTSELFILVFSRTMTGSSTCKATSWIIFACKTYPRWYFSKISNTYLWEMLTFLRVQRTFSLIWYYSSNEVLHESFSVMSSMLVRFE